jgi:hypothetical protein
MHLERGGMLFAEGLDRPLQVVAGAVQELSGQLWRWRELPM